MLCIVDRWSGSQCDDMGQLATTTATAAVAVVAAAVVVLIVVAVVVAVVHAVVAQLISIPHLLSEKWL